MKSEARRIVEYILSVDEEDLSCEECFDLLDSYIDVELTGEDAAAQFPEVAQHLSRCPACWREYQDLYQLLRDSREGHLLSPPTRPRLDLSAILPPEEVSPGLWTQIERGSRQLAAEITLRLEGSQMSFAALPPLLRPGHLTIEPARLRTMLPEEKLHEGREILALPDEEHNVVIRLGMGPVVKDRGVLILEVERLTSDAPIDQAKGHGRNKTSHATGLCRAGRNVNKPVFQSR